MPQSDSFEAKEIKEKAVQKGRALQFGIVRSCAYFYRLAKKYSYRRLYVPNDFETSFSTRSYVYRELINFNFKYRCQREVWHFHETG